MEDNSNLYDFTLKESKTLKLFRTDWAWKKKRSRIKLRMPSKKKRKAYYNKCMTYTSFLNKYYIKTDKKDDYIPIRNNVYYVKDGYNHYSNGYTLTKLEVWNEYYEYRRTCLK